MIILQETSKQVTQDSKQFTLKLKNMKLHLTELLNKQIRLDLEIKNLKRSIVNKQKEYEKSLKVKLTLESTETLDKYPELELPTKDPHLYHSLIQFDEISLEIQELLEEKFPEET